VRYPHEYVRAGTAKQMTLFHPASCIRHREVSPPETKRH
jgi:hypothetical protein